MATGWAINLHVWTFLMLTSKAWPQTSEMRDLPSSYRGTFAHIMNILTGNESLSSHNSNP
jgi:hypothetical protein